MKNTYRAPTHLFAIIGALIERGGRPFDRTERYAIRYPRTWQSRLEHGDYSEFRIGYRSKS